LIELSEPATNVYKYIELKKTPLVIVDTLSFTEENVHSNQKEEILAVLEGWRSNWERKRLDDYINYYSEHFRDSRRNYSQFKTYKTSIFNSYKINHIKLDNIIIIKHNNGLIAKFDQEYDASNMQSTNSKELYFIKENNFWKIIAEKIRN